MKKPIFIMPKEITAINLRHKLGEILDIPDAVTTRDVHTTGEDGVMGGIPFGTDFLPEP